jgi:hypothetical protein
MPLSVESTPAGAFCFRLADKSHFVSLTKLTRLCELPHRKPPLQNPIFVMFFLTNEVLPGFHAAFQKE